MSPIGTRPNSSGRRRTRRLAAIAVLGALGLAACGGDDDAGSSDDRDETEDTRAPETTDAPETTEAPATTAPPTTEVVKTVPTTEATGGLDAVPGAVVQIIAQGTFVDPEFGTYEGAGAGTGFVIDPSGIAVTNNHVVGGAGLLQVYVQGEDRPRNARVLGVSECSDLAVIDIDGAELPTLGWYEGAANPGLDIYVAGYPLGEPEFTLTRGIVSKAEANGDTGWASIDHVIEHDAAAQGGNSGGPLVNDDGEVVGVHYASNNRTNTSQFYAIAADDAQVIVDELRAGNDVDSIGVNGQVVVNEDGTIAGLWVSGVESGSPADEAGVAPGDIITRIEGVSIGTDGTMRDYCDVLRTHTADDQLAIEVLRYATEEVLTGELNGDSLVTAFSFAQTYDDTVADGGTTYTDYVQVTDDTGLITVAVPVEWSDVDGTTIDLGGGEVAPSIAAAPDLAGYRETWDVPGMEFIAAGSLASWTDDELLDLVAPTDCTATGRNAYDDGTFVGLFEVFEGCGGTDTQYFVVVSHTPDGGAGVIVAVQVVTDADLDALDSVLRTFNVTN